MKERLTNNAGLKIISVIFAMLLWLVVVNISDPTITKTFNGIPINVQDTDVITNKGKTYDRIDDSKTANVTVTAKRSDIESIKASDIHATASMKNLMEGYLIPIDITIDGYEGVYQSAEVSPVNIQVSIEDTASNKFPITVVTDGDVQDGFIIGSTTAKPSAVTISGARSVINSISRVVVKADVSSLSEDETINGELLVYDKDGNIIDQTQLNTNLGSGGAKVKVDLYSTKEVDLEFNTAGSPAFGYVCSDVNCEPQTAVIAGEEDIIEDIDKIIIPSKALNISGADSSIEQTIDISEYLPDGIILYDETTKNVAVSVVIERLGTKTISIPSGSIIINNVPDKMRASFKTGDDVELNFAGTREALDSLTEDKISASVDLANYTKEGTYNVPVKVEMPDGCSLSKSVKLEIVLTKD